MAAGSVAAVAAGTVAVAVVAASVVADRSAKPAGKVAHEPQMSTSGFVISTKCAGLVSFSGS